MQGMNSMHELFNKVKQAASSIPTDESEMAPGRMQMREDAPSREKDSLGRPWGEGSLNNDTPPTYSTAVERENEEGRRRLLERSFEGVSGMATTDTRLLKELFQNFGAASTTSHSPLLQKKASHASPPTLAEAIRRLR